MEIRTMRMLLNTLVKISVSGEDNLNMMLGSIQLLKGEIVKAEEEAKQREADRIDHDNQGN